MDTNPYAPPKAVVADAPLSTGLKRRSVVLMIVFTLVTLGMYYPIWFFRRRRALNSLNSSRKLRLWPLLAFCVVYALEFAVGFASGEGSPEQTIGPSAVKLLDLLQLIVGIFMLFQCFIIKDILEDHLTEPEDPAARRLFVERVKLSGLLTFFFGIFYLQYVINRDIAGSQRAAV